MRTLRSRARIVARIGLLCGIALLTSGCFLINLVSQVIVTSDEELGEVTSAVFQAGTTVNVCLAPIPPFTRFFCGFFINGIPFSSDFKTEPENAFSTPGETLFALFIDPVILQVPAAAGNFSGTFSGPVSGPLSITQVAGSLPADINTQITPEPGTKLVIVDFPNPPPPLNNQTYTFTLNFRLPGNVTPLRVKALFAGRVQIDGQTFFPPILPCETNFANIPTITLPRSSTFQNVNLPLTGVQGCNGRVYSYGPGGPPPIPTTSEWGLLVLSLLLASYAAIRLRRRTC